MLARYWSVYTNSRVAGTGRFNKMGSKYIPHACNRITPSSVTVFCFFDFLPFFFSRHSHNISNHIGVLTEVRLTQRAVVVAIHEPVLDTPAMKDMHTRERMNGVAHEDGLETDGTDGTESVSMRSSISKEQKDRPRKIVVMVPQRLPTLS